MTAKGAARRKLDPEAPAWVRCQSCDGYWCLIHREHAESCPCPPVEEWPVSPYEDGSQARAPVVPLMLT